MQKRQCTVRSHLHIPVCILVRSKHSAGYPSFVKFLLQSGDFLQTLCFTDHLLHALALAAGELDAHGLVGGGGGGRGAGDVECARFDAQELGGQLGWLLDGTEELLGLFALGVLHFLVVEEAYRGGQPDDPVPIMLDNC